MKGTPVSTSSSSAAPIISSISLMTQELEPFYEKGRYMFKMDTAGEINKVMKLLI
jgi:hypothetical protein